MMLRNGMASGLQRWRLDFGTLSSSGPVAKAVARCATSCTPPSPLRVGRQQLGCWRIKASLLVGWDAAWGWAQHPLPVPLLLLAGVLVMGRPLRKAAGKFCAGRVGWDRETALFSRRHRKQPTSLVMDPAPGCQWVASRNPAHTAPLCPVPAWLGWG